MKVPFRLLHLKQDSRLIVLIIFINCFFQLVTSQQIAFPSAYGAGAYTVGGRGGDIIHVTNLNDSGEGSLRWALQDVTNKSITRTIVFDVSGVIDLQSDIYMSNAPGDEGGYADGITIAGQSAPEGGITISGGKIRIYNINNIIVRYLKFRSTGNYDGCLSINNGNNIVIDHLSGSHTGDIVFSVTSSDMISGDHTIQNCLMAQSKNGLIIGDSSPLTDDDYGEVSVLRNAYYNVGWRIPFKGGAAIKVDAINNLAHNWSARLIRMDADNYELNHIGNYYQSGWNSTNVLLHCSWNNNPNASPKIYNEDNFLSSNKQPDGYETDESVAWTEFQVNFNPLPNSWFLNSANSFRGRESTILPSSQVKSSILPLVGSSQYLKDDGTVGFHRDIYDTEFVNGIDEDDSSSRNSDITLPIQSLSNTRPNNFYVSNDHIPEIWFSTNVPEGQNHNDIAPSGYTWLEEYLNQVDGPTISVESVVISPNTASITIPETVTLSTTITPSNASNESGIWTSSDESIAVVDENGVVTPVSQGVVTITFTTNDGGFTDSSQITVFPEALQASAGDDQQICEGDSATLTASGGSNYLWNTGETTSSIQVSPNQTTTYSVTVSDQFGQSDEDSVMVTVNPVPNANAGEDQSICQGESITLNASGGDEYIWSNGETSASITVSPNVDTTYSVEVLSNNCSSTDTVLVSVNPSPQITVSDDISIYNGSSATLVASGGDTYQWSNGETTDAITVSPTVTTTFSVIGFANGCQTTVEVTVNVLEPISANAGDDITICSGENIALSAIGGTSYSWNSGQTGATINVSPTETTTYTVTVSDVLGGTATDSVTVFVNESPIVTLNDNLSIAEGESTTLIANGAQSYLWSTGETTNEINVSPTITTTYAVTGYLNGCESTVEVTVTVIPELVADAGNDITICSGDSVTLNASGGVSYQWNTGETGPSPTVSPTETTVYTVTVFDGVGNSDLDTVTVTVNELPTITITGDITILEGESTNLVAEGAETYLWNTGETSNVINVSPLQTTTYRVEGTTNTCSGQALVTVTVEALFEASAGEDKRVCDDSTYEVVLTANQGDSYLWNNGETTQSIVVSPLSTTTYSVTVSQGEQEDTDDVTVYVDPSPNVAIVNGNNIDILSGDFITLTASGANTYQWNNGATQPNIAVSPSSTTTYEVKGYIGECYDEKQVTVNVFEPVVADAGENVLICPEETAILTASGGDEYVWSTGEVTQSIEVSPIETTEYSVTVFNAMDFDEAAVMVEVDTNCNAGPIDMAQEPLDFSFDIFPNPAEDILNFKFSGISLISGVYIYDVTGKLIKRSKVSNENVNVTETLQIDISDIQTGVYFVKLLNKNRDIVKKLIVK